MTFLIIIMQFFIVGVNHENVNKVKDLPDNCVAIPEIFVPQFSDTRPYQISRGSRFSAKSWTKAFQLIYKAQSQSYFRGIFARNTQKAARDSQFQLFIDLLERYPLLGTQFTIRDSKMKVIHKKSGNFIQGGSFEQPASIMSIPDVTDFWAEEPISREGSIQRRAFQDIAGTLRNSYGIVPQFHFTFNPIGKMNFIYEDFFDEKKKVYDEIQVNDLVVNYDDNPFCPQDRIDFLDAMSKNDPQRYLVDGKGLWGEPTNDKPFFNYYDEKIHFSKREFQFGPYETWLTFDFNHTPCTASVYQMVPGVGIIGMRSYEQNGGTRKLCQFMKLDEELMSVDRLYWNSTGDSNGKNYTATGGDVTDFEIIQEEFNLFDSQIIGVHSRNKPIVYSRRLVDQFFYRVPFIMDRRMTLLNRDLKIAREDDHGKLYKNRKDGYGMDYCDHHRYFVHAICPNGLEDINYLVNRFR